MEQPFPRKAIHSPRETHMMTLQDRAKAFEAQLAHDHDLKFRLLVRRSRLIGQWAADRLGQRGDKAQAYTREIIRLSLESAEQQVVMRKLRLDLGDLVEDADIRGQFARAEEEAKRLVFEDQVP